MVLIATGATPRVLTGAEPDGKRVLTWRQIYDLPELPEHLAVIGSGVTGVEFASAYTEMGVKVTMVSSRDRVLPHEDADAAVVLEDVFAERGTAVVKQTDFGVIGSVICYDMDFTDTARKMTRNGARLIAAPSNDVEAITEAASAPRCCSRRLE